MSAAAAAAVAAGAASAATATAAAEEEEEEGGEDGAYCICREGDDGGVMVECDACSEWYHASW